MSIKNDIFIEASNDNAFVSDSLTDKFDINSLIQKREEKEDSLRERFNSDKILCEIICEDLCFNFDLVEMNQCEDIVDVTGELPTVILSRVIGKKDLKLSLMLGENKILSSLENKHCYINKVKVKNSQIAEIKIKFYVSKDN